MKKLIFLLAAVALTFTSCEGPMGPPGPQGVPGQNGQDGQDGRDGNNGRDGQGTYGFHRSFTVNTNNWRLEGGDNPGDLGTYFSYRVAVRDLTQRIYDEGSIVAYIEDSDGRKNGMPFVFHRGEMQDNGEAYTWTETYDFDFSIDAYGGWVTFYLTYSDFSTHIDPDRNKTFHIVVFWNNESN